MVKLISIVSLAILVTVCYCSGWNTYLDIIIDSSRIGGKPLIDRGCIIGKDGSRWTTDDHPNALTFSDEEVALIATAFENKDLTNFGVHVDGDLYGCNTHDDKEILLRRARHGNVILRSTKLSVIVGHTPNMYQNVMASDIIKNVANYLIHMNY